MRSTAAIIHVIAGAREAMEEHMEIANKALCETGSIHDLDNRHEQMEADLCFARELQLAFLPQQYPNCSYNSPSGVSALKFTHRYQPATTLAGDIFNISAISDTAAGIFICDVMGHGVRSGLVAMVLHGLVEKWTPLISEPGALLTEINRDLAAILNRADVHMFASAFYMVVDVASGQVRYANAGHPSPLRLDRRENALEYMSTNGHATNPALGLLEPFSYPTYQLSLADRDLFVLFTDGLYEVDGPDGQQFGEERLLTAFHSRIGKESDEMFDEIISEIRAFSANAEFNDDVCLVGVEVATASS